MLKEGRRGQFTALVILGVVLILAVGTIVYTTSQTSEQEAEEQADVEEVSTLRGFIEECGSSVAREAIVKMGEHGGYVNPENTDLSGEAFTKVQGFPTLSSGVETFGEETFVPYWYYLKSSNTCQADCSFSSKKPSMELIREQIARYVEENLDQCIQDFQPLEDAQDIEERGEPEADVTIEEERVSVRINYPVRIITDTGTEDLEEFDSYVNVDLQNVYKTASEIVNEFTANDTKYLEKMTILLIAAYSMGENPLLPPIFGSVDISTTPYFTSKQEVDRNLRQILQDHIPSISISGAADNVIPVTDNNLTNSIHKSYVASIDDEIQNLELSGMRIDFQYLETWKPYLEVTGGDTSGGIIKSEMMPLIPSIGPITIPLFLKNMNFIYDVSYPVVVELTDENAFNGEGYRFRFGMEVNVRDNNWSVAPESNTISAETDETFLCHPDNRNSGNITVTVEGAAEGEPISEAVVMFQCARETCLIGKTNKTGGLKSRFPICAGGELSAQKIGYHGVPAAMATAPDREDEETIEMYEATPVNAEVRKRPILKTGYTGDKVPEPIWIQSDTEESLHIDEEAIIIMERQEEPQFTSVVRYNGSLTPVTTELIPGTYSLEGILRRDLGENYSTEEWVIPEETIEYDTNGPIPGGTETVTMEPITFNKSLILGGVEGLNFTVTQEELRKGRIALYVSAIKMEDLERHTDLTGMTSYTNFTRSNPSLFRPKFVVD